VPNFHEKLCNSLNDQSSGSKNYWHILKLLLGKKFNSEIPALQTDEKIIDDYDKSRLNFVLNFTLTMPIEVNVSADNVRS
jgi:hypothetical protein